MLASIRSRIEPSESGIDRSRTRKLMQVHDEFRVLKTDDERSNSVAQLRQIHG